MKFFAIVILVGLLPACAKKESIICCVLPPVEMVRTQTQCADDWGYGTTDNETIAKLSAYLASKKITTSKITLAATGLQSVCQACTCSKGFEFHVWSQANYIDSLTSLGFTIR